VTPTIRTSTSTFPTILKRLLPRFTAANSKNLKSCATSRACTTKDGMYVDTLIAFDEAYNLGILTAYRGPPNTDVDFSDCFHDFRRLAEITSQKILMEAARRVKVGAQQIVVLDAPACQAIHALINAILEKLNQLTLSEARRESLFKLINCLVYLACRPGSLDCEGTGRND
jgi:hypothetical protein